MGYKRDRQPSPLLVVVCISIVFLLIAFGGRRTAVGVVLTHYEIR
jgi:hypothetical protein